MLFNSFAFFLVFLPLALLGYFVLSRYSLRLSIIFLLFASVAFYCYWDISFLPLLAVSVCTNFAVGRGIALRHGQGRLKAAKGALVAGLVFNLSLLVFFKYADFLLGNVAALTGASIAPLGVVLPIGISFFTFTQIAYLVDCHAGKVKDYHPESYGLFVTYFPHLIAGPILHHKDMMPQFSQPASHVFQRGRLVLGLGYFTIGLFKKVILADGVARFVGPVFDLHHQHLTMLEAWAGALAYTFQLYFDFSAYSDMAYGLSYMFGIVLPINFNSPYKATSIIDFWRRWHITLSTFLRDYLYIALGGNRHGAFQRYRNLFLTMLLGGLWHGANWTFVVWGMLHGAYLIVNHALRHVLGQRGNLALRLAGAAATFLAVVLAWVFFRASSVAVAVDVLQAMAGGTLSPGMQGAMLGMSRIMALPSCLAWLAACALTAFCLPNAYQLLGRGLRPEQEQRLEGQGGALLLGAMLLLCMLLLAVSETRGVSEFLYFNF
ncbi:MBOAT family protein [Janthinobacterium sp. PC23-8]|uniref:MBOAT family O-acyltransferase n=1 Tax=Janthinobacterium sp. PC23-8 TaxID=2012679 RepID=UPI000B9664B4|nr:MBOAT family protein [Janthinobacterium sp. PC23-8]OYO26351.1 membrane-bound O-acyltransferase family protein [Janthinobacterium sp. PC23-8]